MCIDSNLIFLGKDFWTVNMPYLQKISSQPVDHKVKIRATVHVALMLIVKLDMNS